MSNHCVSNQSDDMFSVLDISAPQRNMLLIQPEFGNLNPDLQRTCELDCCSVLCNGASEDLNVHDTKCNEENV